MIIAHLDKDLKVFSMSGDLDVMTSPVSVFVDVIFVLVKFSGHRSNANKDINPYINCI